jgi:hypothetical protein
VIVNDTLPAGTTLVSATASQGSCSGTGPVVCALGTVLNGANATVTIVVALPSTSGIFLNAATASSAQTDPTPAFAPATVVAIAPAATPIPTLSEWALLMLVIALAGFAVMRIQS